MRSRENMFFRRIWFVVLGAIIGITISSQLFHLPVANAQSSAISGDSIDLLTRTGRAMAEVTTAVKPAIVNISTTRTVKISGGMDPFMDDPFFKKFFGDNFGRQKHPKEQKSIA